MVRTALAFGLLVLLLVAIYGGGVGRGFVKDDVVWVGENRVASLEEMRKLVMRSNGFYRPAVALTFALDRAIYDTRPRGFGVTNFALLIAAGGAIVWLGRGLGLGTGVATTAAAIWALNFHGINMAVLWLSGRTALVVTLFAVVAAGAVVRARPIAAGAAALAAMLSKEEAVALPLIMAAWVWLQSDSESGRQATASTHDTRPSAVPGDMVRRSTRDALVRVARMTWPAWIALAIYLALRSRTAAYTPASSPWFYRFTFAPQDVFTNLWQYADRACTFSVLALLVAALVAGRRPHWTDRGPESRSGGSASRGPQTLRQMLPYGLVWLAGGFALTLFLPVRSSLYACLPSVGPALVAAVGIHAIWTASSSAARRRLAVAATAVPICLLPVYWSRNERWVEIADLSAVTFAAVRDTVPTRGDTPHLIFHDDRATRRSLGAAFGTLLPEAVTLAAGRPLPVWLEPPPDDWKGSRLTPPASDATNAKILRYRVDGDTLQVRIDPPANGKGRL